MTSAGEKDKALRLLEDYFQGDERALTAVRFLQERQQGGGAVLAAAPRERFPVPMEVAGKEGFFALFSDGACRGNPGPGAWGAMGQDAGGEVLFESSGLDFSTTNNRMELEGAIVALDELHRHLKQNLSLPLRGVFLYSDSKYVVDGMTQWVKGWKRRGWKKADKSIPLNLDLWKRLDHSAGQFSRLQFCWVKGHSGHPQNEYVDKLANKALDDCKGPLL